MIIYSRDLPTRGLLGGRSSANIYPMKFDELLEFIGDQQLTSFREYISKLSVLVNKDPNIGEFSLLDADNILFLFDAITINKQLTFPITVKCPYCGKNHTVQVKSNEVEFRDLPDKAISILTVKLNDKLYPIKYITINEFINKIAKLPRYLENKSINTIKLISMIDTPLTVSTNLVLSATQEDIATLVLLEKLWFNLINPIKVECDIPDSETNEKRYFTAAISLSAVDTFQKIFESNPVTEDKIQFSETRKSKN